MNSVLMKAIVECAIFLGMANDDIVNPDAAVVQLEQLSFLLKQLSIEEQRDFCRFIDKLAQEEQSSDGINERVVFLKTLPENLGLPST